MALSGAYKSTIRALLLIAFAVVLASCCNEESNRKFTLFDYGKGAFLFTEVVPAESEAIVLTDCYKGTIKGISLSVSTESAYSLACLNSREREQTLTDIFSKEGYAIPMLNTFYCDAEDSLEVFSSEFYHDVIDTTYSISSAITEISGIKEREKDSLRVISTPSDSIFGKHLSSATIAKYIVSSINGGMVQINGTNFLSDDASVKLLKVLSRSFLPGNKIVQVSQISEMGDSVAICAIEKQNGVSYSIIIVSTLSKTEKINVRIGAEQYRFKVKPYSVNLFDVTM